MPRLRNASSFLSSHAVHAFLRQANPPRTASLCVTALGMVLSIALILPGFSEAHTDNHKAPVYPILECVTAGANGSYTALFGYKNENSFTVTIPIGSNNKFSPSPIDRGQTTVFKPGRIVEAFRVSLSSCAFERLLV